MISIKSDVKDLTRKLSRQQRVVIPQATADTLNKVISKINTATKKTLAAAVGVAQKHFKTRFHVYRANARRLKVKNWIGLRYGVRASELPGAAQRRTLKGLNVQSKPFMATMKSGKTKHFVRVEKTGSTKDSRGRTKGRPHTSSKNLPIVDIFSRSVHLPENSRVIHKRLASEIMRREFRKTFRKQLKFRLKKKGLY